VSACSSSGTFAAAHRLVGGSCLLLVAGGSVHPTEDYAGICAGQQPSLLAPGAGLGVGHGVLLARRHVIETVASMPELASNRMHVALKRATVGNYTSWAWYDTAKDRHYAMASHDTGA